MTKKILVATEKPFAPEAIELMKKALASYSGYTMELLENYKDPADFKKAIKDADAVIIRSDKATKEVIDAGDKLKVIVRAGAGYDNIDLQAATSKKVVAMNTPGQNSNAVAELAIGMMLYMARCKFNGKSGTELKGKKLGIHTYGNVAKAIAVIAKGFGMEVYVHHYRYRKEIEEDGYIRVETPQEFYAKCDYVSLNMPANDTTKKSINYDLLKLMPKNATLINTARKEVICEESLKKIFAERTDLKYASDIAPDIAAELSEKYPDRVFFTPKKMGAQSAEANINAGVAAIHQIVAYFEKGDTTFQVNK